jgi:AbrB family transcriptional regulator (stage V sporulation protein T)
MKATSTVRRIDNLGRIVIPKEVRRTLRIRDGDPLEIFVAHEGEVVLKKYSHISELEDLAQEYAESLAAVLGHIALISDREQIVAVAGWSKEIFSSEAHRVEAVLRGNGGKEGGPFFPARPTSGLQDLPGR